MRFITKPILLILLLLLFGLAAPSSVADEPIDSATTVRSTQLLSEPSHGSASVMQLDAQASLAVYERQRLWVRVAPEGDVENQGWLRFTELRFKRAAPQGAVETPSSGGFAGFSRSVSGFLSSFRGRNARSASATSTIGIRGLTAAELQSAQPDAASLQWIGAYAMSAEQAQQFATAGGLSAKAIAGE